MVESTGNKGMPSQMERVDWSISDLSGLEGGHGMYFLRTNVRTIKRIGEPCYWTEIV